MNKYIIIIGLVVACLSCILSTKSCEEHIEEFLKSAIDIARCNWNSHLCHVCQSVQTIGDVNVAKIFGEKCVEDGDYANACHPEHKTYNWYEDHCLKARNFTLYDSTCEDLLEQATVALPLSATHIVQNNKTEYTPEQKTTPISHNDKIGSDQIGFAYSTVLITVVVILGILIVLVIGLYGCHWNQMNKIKALTKRLRLQKTGDHDIHSSESAMGHVTSDVTSSQDQRTAPTGTALYNRRLDRVQVRAGAGRSENIHRNVGEGLEENSPLLSDAAASDNGSQSAAGLDAPVVVDPPGHVTSDVTSLEDRRTDPAAGACGGVADGHETEVLDTLKDDERNPETVTETSTGEECSPAVTDAYNIIKDKGLNDKEQEALINMLKLRLKEPLVAPVTQLDITAGNEALMVEAQSDLAGKNILASKPESQPEKGSCSGTAKGELPTIDEQPNNIVNPSTSKDFLEDETQSGKRKSLVSQESLREAACSKRRSRHSQVSESEDDKSKLEECGPDKTDVPSPEESKA